MAFGIDFSGKTVLVTGVSSGIGAGIARMFAKAGANVSGCALEEESHSQVKFFEKMITEESGKPPLYVQADVTDEQAVRSFVCKTADHFGSIDILASNAGTNINTGIDNCIPEQWSANLKLNLESHLVVARLCKPHFDKAGKGVIIINSSCHAYSTMEDNFPYNVAKTGLTALVRSLTIEWGPAVRTVAVAPGFIDTPLAEKWFAQFPDKEEARKEIVDKHPLKRLGTPDEIGAWFVFLASDYAAFAGGQTFLIDGGRSSLMF